MFPKYSLFIFPFLHLCSYAQHETINVSPSSISKLKNRLKLRAIEATAKARLSSLLGSARNCPSTSTHTGDVWVSSDPNHCIGDCSGTKIHPWSDTINTCQTGDDYYIPGNVHKHNGNSGTINDGKNFCLTGSCDSNEPPSQCWKDNQATCASGREDSTHCPACAAGRYNQFSRNDCKIVPPGGFNEGTGRSRYIKCKAGTYQPYYAASGCFLCAPGYYQDAEGQYSCKSCPFGKTTYTVNHLGLVLPQFGSKCPSACRAPLIDNQAYYNPKNGRNWDPGGMPSSQCTKMHDFYTGEGNTGVSHLNSLNDIHKWWSYSGTIHHIGMSELMYSQVANLLTSTTTPISTNPLFNGNAKASEYLFIALVTGCALTYPGYLNSNQPRNFRDNALIVTADGGGPAQWVLCPAGMWCAANIPIKTNGIPAYNYQVLTLGNGISYCQSGFHCDKGSSTKFGTNTNGVKVRYCSAGQICRMGGQYPTTNTFAASADCPRGYYCPEGTGDHNFEQYKCPMGTFGSQTGLQGKAGCAKCADGTICDGLGLKAAGADCGFGRWCKNKPYQAYTYYKGGQFSLTTRSPGYWVGWARCPEGRWCDVATHITKVDDHMCKRGYYCPRGVASEEESKTYKCKVGRICNEEGTTNINGTMPCKPGRFCPAGMNEYTHTHYHPDIIPLTDCISHNNCRHGGRRADGKSDMCAPDHIAVKRGNSRLDVYTKNPSIEHKTIQGVAGIFTANDPSYNPDDRICTSKKEWKNGVGVCAPWMNCKGAWGTNLIKNYVAHMQDDMDLQGMDFLSKRRKKTAGFPMMMDSLDSGYRKHHFAATSPISGSGSTWCAGNGFGFLPGEGAWCQDSTGGMYDYTDKISTPTLTTASSTVHHPEGPNTTRGECSTILRMGHVGGCRTGEFHTNYVYNYIKLSKIHYHSIFENSQMDRDFLYNGISEETDKSRTSYLYGQDTGASVHGNGITVARGRLLRNSKDTLLDIVIESSDWRQNSFNILDYPKLRRFVDNTNEYDTFPLGQLPPTPCMLREIRFVASPQWGNSNPGLPTSIENIAADWQYNCPYLKTFEFMKSGTKYDVMARQLKPESWPGFFYSCMSSKFKNWEYSKQSGSVHSSCSDFTIGTSSFPPPVGGGSPLIFSDWYGSGDYNDPLWGEVGWNTFDGIGECTESNRGKCRLGKDQQYTCEDISLLSLSSRMHEFQYFKAEYVYDEKTYTYLMGQACCEFFGGTIGISNTITSSKCANNDCSCTNQRAIGDYRTVTAVNPDSNNVRSGCFKTDYWQAKSPAERREVFGMTNQKDDFVSTVASDYCSVRHCEVPRFRDIPKVLNYGECSSPVKEPYSTLSEHGRKGVYALLYDSTATPATFKHYLFAGQWCKGNCADGFHPRSSKDRHECSAYGELVSDIECDLKPCDWTTLSGDIVDALTKANVTSDTTLCKYHFDQYDDVYEKGFKQSPAQLWNGCSPPAEICPSLQIKSAIQCSLHKETGRYYFPQLQTFVSSEKTFTNKVTLDDICHPITEAPTGAPTKNPTSAPTENPTNAPTENPTKAPTKNPTKAPTKNPTRAPTKNPTRAPTKSPTNAPTDLRCANGVKDYYESDKDCGGIECHPCGVNNACTMDNDCVDKMYCSDPPNPMCTITTNGPTKAPTDGPTKAPTVVPTKAPTVAPTNVDPTANPTRSPTFAVVESVLKLEGISIDNFNLQQFIKLMAQHLGVLPSQITIVSTDVLSQGSGRRLQNSAMRVITSSSQGVIVTFTVSTENVAAETLDNKLTDEVELEGVFVNSFYPALQDVSNVVVGATTNVPAPTSDDDSEGLNIALIAVLGGGGLALVFAVWYFFIR